MSESTFQIVFRGKLLAGFERDQVRANLAQLFKSDPARIDALLDAPKTVLKAGLPREAANRYQEVLRQAGIMVALIGDSTVSTPASISPAAASIVAEPSVITTPSAMPPNAITPPPTNLAVDPHAVANAVTSTARGFTLAAAGEQIIPSARSDDPQIDTSSLSLAAVGVTLVEGRAVTPPHFNLDSMSIAADSGPIDKTPKHAPARIDTSGLSLTETSLEARAEEPLSELQKLLSTSVD